MVIKQKKRNEIPNEYKWDLSDLIKDEKEFNKLYSEVIRLINKVARCKGKILESEKSLYDFLILEEELDKKIIILYFYSFNLYNVDTTNNDNLSLKLKVENLEKLSEKLSFINNELINGEQKIKEYLKKNKKLKIYKHYFNNLFRLKKHILNDESEELITKISSGILDMEEVFTNINSADIKLDNIKDEDGNTVELTQGNYNKYFQSNKVSVRKSVFEGIYNYYKNHINTLASTLRGKIKLFLALSNIRKYSDSLSISLSEENISKNVYLNLIESVHNNLKALHEYIRIKKEILKVKEYHMYDIYVNPISLNIKVKYEESKDIIKKALMPLGEDYINNLNKAFNEKWIDVFPNKGKCSGAYCNGCCTDTYPRVLTNYDDTVLDVSTLAHELGHAMHSYYSNKNQPYIYHDYTIFLAEIASTVNELLLSEYHSNNSKNMNEKMYYLVEFLEKVKSTIYRQTMFAEFELIMHNNEKNNIPLTVSTFCDKYYELNKKYYGKHIIHDDLIRYEWSRISHFYRPFYVYKYATGLSCAIVIVNKLLNNEEGFKEKYIKFLSSGSRDYSTNLLKELGIDIEDKDVVNNALKVFENKLNDLKKIANIK